MLILSVLLGSARPDQRERSLFLAARAASFARRTGPVPQEKATGPFQVPAPTTHETFHEPFCPRAKTSVCALDGRVGSNDSDLVWVDGSAGRFFGSLGAGMVSHSVCGCVHNPPLDRHVQPGRSTEYSTGRPTNVTWFTPEATLTSGSTKIGRINGVCWSPRHYRRCVPRRRLENNFRFCCDALLAARTSWSMRVLCASSRYSRRSMMPLSTKPVAEHGCADVEVRLVSNI
jgi:hypothetical protein